MCACMSANQLQINRLQIPFLISANNSGEGLSQNNATLAQEAQLKSITNRRQKKNRATVAP